MIVAGRIRFIRLTTVAGLLFSSLAPPLASIAQQSSSTGPVYFVPNEVLVGLDQDTASLARRSLRSRGSSTGIPPLDALNREWRVRRIVPLVRSVTPSLNRFESQLANVFKLVIAADVDPTEMIRAYEALSEVDYAELNYIYDVHADVVPSDEFFSDQWALSNESGEDIDALESWLIERGSRTTKVAVVDTGVNHQHEDLQTSRIMTELDRDFVNNDHDAMDDHGHGTHVAGIIAAESDNGIGISGVCWGCSVLPVKVLSSDGTGTAEDVAKGIRYAARNGAQVINMSLGIKAGCGCSETVARALNYAWSSGSLLIAASGNDSNHKELSHPASSSVVMAIGATNRRDKVTGFSNRGKGLDLVAPGDEILSLYLGKSGYRTFRGTSMAAPHAAGVAGLLFSSQPHLTAGDAWSVLTRSSDDLGKNGWDRKYGWGRLNALRALQQASADTMNPARDSCDSEPDPGCCSAAIAAPDLRAHGLMPAIRDLRDRVLGTTQPGEHWIRLYYRHMIEVGALIVSDSEVRAANTRVFRTFESLILSWQVGGNERLTSEHVDALASLFQVLRAKASERLARAAQLEWERVDLHRFVGERPEEILAILEQENRTSPTLHRRGAAP